MERRAFVLSRPAFLSEKYGSVRCAAVGVDTVYVGTSSGRIVQLRPHGEEDRRKTGAATALRGVTPQTCGESHVLGADVASIAYVAAEALVAAVAAEKLHLLVGGAWEERQSSSSSTRRSGGGMNAERPSSIRDASQPSGFEANDARVLKELELPQRIANLRVERCAASTSTSASALTTAASEDGAMMVSPSSLLVLCASPRRARTENSPRIERMCRGILVCSVRRRRRSSTSGGGPQAMGGVAVDVLRSVEVPMEAGPVCSVRLCGEGVVWASRRGYWTLPASNDMPMPLFEPTSSNGSGGNDRNAAKPMACVAASPEPGEALLINGDVGIAVDSEGQPSGSSVVIPAKSVSVASSRGYLLALGEGALGVYDVRRDAEDEVHGGRGGMRVQSLPVPAGPGAEIVAGENFVAIVAAPERIFCLFAMPMREQVRELLRIGALHDAQSLLVKAQAAALLHTDPGVEGENDDEHFKSGWIGQAFGELGWCLIHALEFERAASVFLDYCHHSGHKDQAQQQQQQPHVHVSPRGGRGGMTSDRDEEYARPGTESSGSTQSEPSTSFSASELVPLFPDESIAFLSSLSNIRRSRWRIAAPPVELKRLVRRELNRRREKDNGGIGVDNVDNEEGFDAMVEQKYAEGVDALLAMLEKMRSRRLRLPRSLREEKWSSAGDSSVMCDITELLMLVLYERRGRASDAEALCAGLVAERGAPIALVPRTSIRIILARLSERGLHHAGAMLLSAYADAVSNISAADWGRRAALSTWRDLGLGKLIDRGCECATPEMSSPSSLSSPEPKASRASTPTRASMSPTSDEQPQLLLRLEQQRRVAIRSSMDVLRRCTAVECVVDFAGWILDTAPLDAMQMLTHLRDLPLDSVSEHARVAGSATDAHDVDVDVDVGGVTVASLGERDFDGASSNAQAPHQLLDENHARHRLSRHRNSRSRQSAPPLPTDVVRRILAPRDPVLLYGFLQYVHCRGRDPDWKLSTALAHTAMDVALRELLPSEANSPPSSASVLEAVDPHGNEPMRSRLQSLLRHAPARELKLTSALRAASRGALYAEQAILYRRLGKHADALVVLALLLRDYVAAEEYCAEVDGMDARDREDGCYVTLLDIYLNPRTHFLEHRRRSASMRVDEADVSLNDFAESMDPMYEPAIALMSSAGARRVLNPLTVLSALAGDEEDGKGSPPLSVVAALLLRIVREHSHKAMEARMVRAMEKKMNLDAAGERLTMHKQRVVVTERVACASCGSSLGSKVFARMPSETGKSSAASMTPDRFGTRGISTGPRGGSLLCYKCLSKTDKSFQTLKL